MGVVLILSEGTSHFQLWRYLERSIEKQQISRLDNKTFGTYTLLANTEKNCYEAFKIQPPRCKNKKVKILDVNPIQNYLSSGNTCKQPISHMSHDLSPP